MIVIDFCIKISEFASCQNSSNDYLNVRNKVIYTDNLTVECKYNETTQFRKLLMLFHFSGYF